MLKWLQFIIAETFSKADVFWAMTEAVATALAALLIVGQLKRFRQESSSHRIAGYDWLFRWFGTERFGKLYDAVESIAQLRPTEWNGTDQALITVLADIDLLNDLISSCRESRHASSGVGRAK